VVHARDIVAIKVAQVKRKEDRRPGFFFSPAAESILSRSEISDRLGRQKRPPPSKIIVAAPRSLAAYSIVEHRVVQS
jgi:hypothetical protein